MFYLITTSQGLNLEEWENYKFTRPHELIFRVRL